MLSVRSGLQAMAVGRTRAAAWARPGPPHASGTASALPCPEDFPDPASPTMDRLVPGLEALRHLGFIPTPQAGCDNPGYPTPGTHRITQVAPSTGTVGKDLTRVVRQCLWARPAILGIGRCDGNFLHQRCVGIGTDMGPEAVKGWFALIFDPASIAVILTGRGDDGCIGLRAGLDPNGLGLEPTCDPDEQ